MEVSPLRFSRWVVPAFAALAIAAGPSPSGQRLDGISAVVNDDVVLSSDVEEQLYLFLLRNQLQPDSAMVDTLRHQILDQLIDEKLIVAEARRRGFTASVAEIARQVDQSIAEAKERLGSEAAFREQLARENLNEDKLRDKYRAEVERQLLAQRLVQKELPRRSVTPAEAEAYFKQHPEKFPMMSAEVRLSVIQIPVLADSAESAKAKAKAAAARKRILAGEKFAKVAQEVSEDPGSARAGGDLGFFPRGSMDPEFDAAAFALKIGEVSQPVRTPFGWHVIEVIDRDTLKTRAGRDSLDADGQPVLETHARHILTRVDLSDADAERARKLAERVRGEASKGTDFAILARRYSQYRGPASEGGDLSFVSLASLAPNIRAGVDSLELGQVSEVLANPAGFNIFKVTDRHPERPYKLDEIRGELPDVVAQILQRERYEEWVKGLRAKAHVEIRDS